MSLVVDGIADLMRMPSAGDLVIYGTDAPNGSVSFIPEHGAHPGPSASEMQTFNIRPVGVTLPARITHPVQLYDHFIRYQTPTWRFRRPLARRSCAGAVLAADSLASR